MLSSKRGLLVLFAVIGLGIVIPFYSPLKMDAAALPTPPATLTPQRAQVPSPTPGSLLLTSPNPTDTELLQLFFATRRPEIMAEYIALGTDTDKPYKFPRQRIDLNHDGQSEILVTGVISWYEYAFVGIITFRDGHWQEMFFSERDGHYCIDVSATVRTAEIVIDYVSCSGGTGSLNKSWQEHWVRCGDAKCSEILSFPVLYWTSQVQGEVDSIYYESSEVHETQEQGLEVKTSRFGISLFHPWSHNDILPTIARRIEGFNTLTRYTWDGSLFRETSKDTVMPQLEIAGEIDPEAQKVRNLLPYAPAEFARIWGISHSLEDDLEWGTKVIQPIWGTPHLSIVAGAQEPRAKLVAAVLGAKNHRKCRLTVQRTEIDSLEFVGQQDLLCTPNFTKVYWLDLDRDNRKELFVLTIAPNDVMRQILTIYSVDKSLTQMTEVVGYFNRSGRGIKWETDTDGLYISATTEFEDSCLTLKCLRLGERWKTYHWDSKNNQLVQESTP